MSVFKEIDRIEMPSHERFWRDYVLQQKPVIITNLFEGPLSEIRTLERALSTFPDMLLEIRDEYVNDVIANTAHLSKIDKYTFAEYVDYIRAHPDTIKMSIEHHPDEDFLKLIKPPPICEPFGEGEARESRREQRPLLFVGNRGNKAHLHFDTAQFHNIQYQIFGRKRFILVAPREAKKLLPHKSFSMVFLENMPEAEKTKFVDYVDGIDGIVEAGEALFMPGLIWHYVEYLEHTMALSLNFGRNQYNRFFGTSLHPDLHLQNIGVHFFDEEALRPHLKSAFEAIENEYFQNPATGRAKYKTMQELFERIYSEVCTDSVQGRYAATNMEPLLESWAGIRRFYGES